LLNAAPFGTGPRELRTPEEGAAEAMLAAWPQHSPSLRTQIIGTLLARDVWILRLLQAVESDVINPAEVPPASRQILARHSNAKIRLQSEKLFPVGSAGERVKVVGKYQTVSSLKGDALKGAVVFQTVCFSCHSYIGQGMPVGPDLKAFYNKSASDFVTAILNPNAAVEPRYTAYTATTMDGRALTGVIANETATSIEVVMPGGLRENILRSDLSEIHATGISLMPDGLEQAITPQAMADLIAFLKSGG
jgi:putative heme-binding domain-containing protein